MWEAGRRWRFDLPSQTAPHHHRLVRPQGLGAAPEGGLGLGAAPQGGLGLGAAPQGGLPVTIADEALTETTLAQGPGQGTTDQAQAEDNNSVS